MRPVAPSRSKVSLGTEVTEADLVAEDIEPRQLAPQPMPLFNTTSEYKRSFAWPRFWRRERAQQTTLGLSNGEEGRQTQRSVLEFDPEEPVSALWPPLLPAPIHAHHFQTVQTGSGQAIPILVHEELAAGNETVVPSALPGHAVHDILSHRMEPSSFATEYHSRYIEGESGVESAT